MAKDALSLLQNEEKWKTFSKNARKQAEQFSLEYIVPLYEEYYEEVIEKVGKRGIEKLEFNNYTPWDSLDGFW